MRCHYCNRDQPLTKDHIVPKSMGGRNATFNIVMACRPCNEAKRDNWPTCTCWKCQQARMRWLCGERGAAIPPPPPPPTFDPVSRNTRWDV